MFKIFFTKKSLRFKTKSFSCRKQQKKKRKKRKGRFWKRLSCIIKIKTPKNHALIKKKKKIRKISAQKIRKLKKSKQRMNYVKSVNL